MVKNNKEKETKKMNKLGLSCAKLCSAYAHYSLAGKILLRLLTDSAEQLVLELDVIMPVIIVTTCLGGGWVLEESRLRLNSAPSWG